MGNDVVHSTSFAAGVKRTAMQMGVLLLIEVGVLFFFGQGIQISSLLLGGLGSYIYLAMLASRVWKAATMHPLVAVRYMRAGLGIRLVFISLLSVFALKQGYHFIYVFLGLITYQLVLRIEGSVAIIKRLFTSM